MKAIRKLLLYEPTHIRSMFFMAVLLMSISDILAQERLSISGKLIDKESSQSIPYAYVSLYKTSDSSLVNVILSDTSGYFNISPVSKGSYRLKVNMLGYQPLSKEIEMNGINNFDSGNWFLRSNTVRLNEAVVIGERMKVKAEREKTTFFVSEKMVDASTNGTDILRLIPGVQIDIMQNISLEGSRNILILVDGKERDRNFVSQIDPRQIEKVEVISALSSKYDASYTGAINIIMKSERNSGISVQINPEIPVSSLIYSHPSGNINWGFNKVNIYTSYTGELIYADIHESKYKKFSANSGSGELRSDQFVRQKYWSHRINYGLDYFINPRNQINFYAFYNPFSRELDGQVELQKTGDTNIKWEADKEDKDINRISYYSLYYKHIFNKKGNEIIFDLSNSRLKAENTTAFTSVELNGSDKILISSVKPGQTASSLKIDYNAFPRKDINFSIGAKAKIQLMHDANSKDFSYRENIFAAYCTFGYKNEKFDMSIGLRYENSTSELAYKFNNSFSSILPYGTLNYKLSSNQNIQLTYSRSITRPNLYQLNPSILNDDPFSVHKGNSLLSPELRGTYYLQHSIRFNNNYLSTRLFYNSASNAICNLTFINDTAAFETRVYNLGTVSQYGVEVTGALKAGKIITFNPYFKLYNLITDGNSLAEQFDVKSRHQVEFESGMSTVFSFRHDYSLSLVFQYSTPKNQIQGNYFSDALYFISFEKTFKNKLKAGVVCALPFTRNFVYNGSEITGTYFYSNYTGKIKIPDIPMGWIKLSYQFNSGRKHEKINHTNEEIDMPPKKGF
jgi:hypothetical protein